MEDPRPETGDQEPKQIPLRYLNSYPGLPASAPVGHPHIIGWDNEDTDKGRLTAADGIATLLFNWKPEALDAFLDFRHKPKYEWYRQTKPGSHIMDVLIARSGNVAVCGFRKDGEWTDYAPFYYTMEESGAWTPLDRRSELFGISFASALMYHQLWVEGEGVKVDVYGA